VDIAIIRLFVIFVKTSTGMRVVIQRVTSASVTIDGKVRSEIGPGLLVLLGIGPDDGAEDIEWLVRKVAGLRIFNDDEGVMNRSVVEIGGEALVVSQFTLMASTKKGNRPSYIGAAGHEIAIPLYETFCRELGAAIGRPVGTGEFGADMKVALLNDGPVTICIDSKNRI
jgi:D-tyrosyl-tRNA(Tyr) deacylase